MAIQAKIIPTTMEQSMETIADHQDTTKTEIINRKHGEFQDVQQCNKFLFTKCL